jgi:hypothetical protein
MARHAWDEDGAADRRRDVLCGPGPALGAWHADWFSPVEQRRACAIHDRPPLGVSLGVDYDGAKSLACVLAD